MSQPMYPQYQSGNHLSQHPYQFGPQADPWQLSGASGTENKVCAGPVAAMSSFRARDVSQTGVAHHSMGSMPPNDQNSHPGVQFQIIMATQGDMANSIAALHLQAGCLIVLVCAVKTFI